MVSVSEACAAGAGEEQAVITTTAVHPRGQRREVGPSHREDRRSVDRVKHVPNIDVNGDVVRGGPALSGCVHHGFTAMGGS